MVLDSSYTCGIGHVKHDFKDMLARIWAPTIWHKLCFSASLFCHCFLPIFLSTHDGGLNDYARFEANMKHKATAFLQGI